MTVNRSFEISACSQKAILLAVVVPEFSDDEPAALSVETLAADIAADEAATETVDAVAQREKDMAGASGPARK